jgi:hypothetical protein
MKIIREAGKGIKTIPASQARKDPEGRKAQRAAYLAQGYDGVRYENEEGVEVFTEASYISPQVSRRFIAALRPVLEDLRGSADSAHEAGQNFGTLFMATVESFYGRENVDRRDFMYGVKSEISAL